MNNITIAILLIVAFQIVDCFTGYLKSKEIVIALVPLPVVLVLCFFFYSDHAWARWGIVIYSLLRMVTQSLEWYAMGSRGRSFFSLSRIWALGSAGLLAALAALLIFFC